VGAVHGIPRLEGDDAPPSEPRELLAKAGGSISERAEIIVGRELKTFETSSHVIGVRAIEGISDPGMFPVIGAEDRFRLIHAVRLKDLLDVESGQHDSLRIPQSEPVAFPKLPRHRLGYVQRDGDGPERSVREPHSPDHAVVVRLAHETGEGREPAVQQELQVAELSRCQVPGGPIA
jgi:hypothetical protein